MNKQLTQLDVTAWCNSHYCNEHDCQYMLNDICTIREHVNPECNICFCMRGEMPCESCDIESDQG